MDESINERIHKILQENKDEYYKTEKNKYKYENVYTKRPIMTPPEGDLYYRLNRNINKKFIIFPQICIRSLFDSNYKITDKAQWCILDFVIFRYQDFIPVLAIELNDRTHLKEEREERDKKVKFLTSRIGIPLWILDTAYSKNEFDKKINWQINQMIKMFPSLKQ